MRLYVPEADLAWFVVADFCIRSSAYSASKVLEINAQLGVK
jgi:hypothetical protein